ncbi:MAG: chemotaxis protein CheX [bacterium]
MSEKITSLKEYVTAACTEILPMFGLEHKFMCELPEKSLNSCEEINILIGLTHGITGSMVVGLTKDSALKIVSGMMGGAEVPELDMMAKSALSEFMNILGGSTVGKIAAEINELVDISTPTIVTGKKMFLMISRAPSKKLFFKLGETKFNIAYCIE